MKICQIKEFLYNILINLIPVRSQVEKRGWDLGSLPKGTFNSVDLIYMYKFD